MFKKNQNRPLSFEYEYQSWWSMPNIKRYKIGRCVNQVLINVTRINHIISISTMYLSLMRKFRKLW